MDQQVKGYPAMPGLRTAARSSAFRRLAAMGLAAIGSVIGAIFARLGAIDAAALPESVRRDIGLTDGRIRPSADGRDADAWSEPAGPGGWRAGSGDRR